MHRRRFLHRATALAAGTFAAPYGFAMSPLAPRYPMGYQLFSVRDILVEDPLTTLRALVKLGYAQFEGYGYDAASDLLYGFAPAELRGHLDELGVRMPSAHFGFADYLDAPDAELLAYTDRCLTAAEALDMRYLVWPVVPESHRTADGFRRLSTRLNLIGAHLAGSGRGLAFHNNGGEFADLGDGTRGYDLVLAEADPELVKLQLDMYWLAHEYGPSPSELTAAHPGRFAMWHVKDMHPETREYTELGAGTIDYEALLPDPKASGLEYLYLEQGGNFTKDSMASAAQNARYWQRELAGRVEQ